MSVVIGLKYKNAVWLACDKQITTGRDKTFLSNHHKIIQVPERPGVLVGSVGLLRGINLLETNNSYIDELCYLREEINYDYMVNTFPLLIHDLFKNQGLIDSDTKILDIKNEFLVGVDDSLYVVGFDGSVQEVEDFAALGSGDRLAIGSLASLYDSNKEYTDEEIIAILYKSIVAANTDLNCGGGVVIMNTISDTVYDFKKIENKEVKNL